VTVTIGSGGSGQGNPAGGAQGSDGVASSLTGSFICSTTTGGGGGGGGSSSTANGRPGGSGGGAGGNYTVGSGTAGPPKTRI
jgi:hypothetical protein